MKKILALDFFRSLLAVCIVIFHTGILMPGLLPDGYLAVQLFFVMSGYFFVKSYYSHFADIKSPEERFTGMVWHRFKRLYPEYIFITLITLLFFRFAIQANPEYDIFFNLIMFGHLGTMGNIVPGSWFVGAMFWSMFVLSACLVWFKEKTLYLIAPLLFMIGNVLLFRHNSNSIAGANIIFLDFIASGICRAFVGISLGMFIYYASKLPVVKTFINKLNKYVVFALVAFMIWYVYYLMTGHSNPYNIYLPATVLMLISVTRDISLKFMKSRFISLLANSSYMLFLTNILTISFLQKYELLNFVDNRWLKQFIVLIACILFSLVCYYAYKVISQNLNRLFYKFNILK